MHKYGPKPIVMLIRMQKKVVWLLRKVMYLYIGSIQPPNGSVKSAKAFQLKINGNPEPILRLFVASVTKKEKMAVFNQSIFHKPLELRSE